jgi:2-polyprenyl-3-methyl-5-hydroxy-6-metoxy-1,4-benzoquinol methylase
MSDVTPNQADEQTIEDLLARLERERLEADRLYNDALTRVDRALQSVPLLPDAPPLFDDARVADLNSHWQLFPGGPPAPGHSLKGRLRGLIWRMVGPAFETQQRFNAAVVEHVNRNLASHQQTARATRDLVGTVGRALEELVRFESLLIQALQTITVYVDSKDRSLGGSDLRQRLALTEQRLLTLKRVVEQSSSPARGDGADATKRVAAHDADAAAPFASAVDSVTYVGFEDRFRGAREEIGRRVEDYVPLLAAANDIVDIGCGRGELLALLTARGVRARGVDVNAAMVDVCRARGFDAELGDAVEFLDRQADDSIGGLIAIQVVEHFTPAYLATFLQTAFHKMRPGAPLIIETINPSCWMAFFETYLRDPTHKQPIHADTLKYLVEASGFSRADVQFRAPVSAADHLVTVEPVNAASGEALSRLAKAVNDHAEKLNRRLFSHMDYVVVARR